MNAQVLEFLIQIAAPIAAALLSWGMIELNRLVRIKVANEQLRGALDRATNAVGAAVGATTQALVADAKAKAKDGKLTKDEASQALTAALQRAREGLGANGLSALRGVIGTDEQAIDRWLVDQIEARIDAVKKGMLY